MNISLLDEQLIELLAENGRQSNQMLANKLNVSTATIRRRLRNLIKNQVLRIVGIVDPTKLGQNLAVVIILSVDNDKLELAIQEIVKMSEIKWASTITGRFNIMAVGRFQSTACFSEFIKNRLSTIKGVTDCDTCICLEVRKGSHVEPS